MSRLFCHLLMATGVQVAASTVQTVAKRDVQADLSGGFCRNWVFGANIVGDVLYMNGMDGGSLDTDKNASNNYFIKVDLSAPVDLQDGSNYKLSLIPTNVPKLRDQALWSNQANSTLFSYGGRSPNGKNLDAGGVWMYSISDGSWEEQKTSVEPVRLIEGAYVNVPELQAAYYLGGYQTKQTTSSITDGTKSYATGMIQYNTTTMEYTMLEAPFTPVQQGALVYLPARDKGALVFLGGEVPASKDGIDTEITPNSWDYVQVYDIEAGVWYKQTTTGDVARRTQFCASVMHDPSSESFQIYVISGADYESKEIVKDVSYLSIPSFKWYRAAGLAKGRMSHTCQAYGRQILGVGGRQSYVPISDPKAGCYKTPAFLYDAQSELVRKTFDPALLSYSIPSSTAGDIQNSPTPSVWDNPSLAFLLTDRSNNNTSAKETQTKPTNKGAIAGGVVGGVAGAAVILGLIWFSLRSRRRKAQQDDTEQPETSERKLPILGELSANQVLRELSTSQSRVEVGSHGSQLYELDGGQTQQSQSQKQSMDRRSEERPEQ